MRRVAALLVHHPVLDRQAAIVTTAITNLDLHDIARSAYTFGLGDFFVSHPVAAQRELALRVREHWTNGSGAKRIPDRKPPMERLTIVESVEHALDALAPAELWVTSAQNGAGATSYRHAREQLAEPGRNVLLTFGTGWGLGPEVLARAALRLEPIRSPRADGFNHLSVRAAAAITFERLLGVQ